MRNGIHWMKYQLRFQLRTLLMWSVLLGAMSLFIGWFYKLFMETGYIQMFDRMPDYFLRAFLGGNADASLDSLRLFISLEFFSWMGLMFAFYPFIAGTASIAGEVETGTIEPLMSKPFSRHTFYWGKYLVMFGCVSVFVAFNFGCLWAGLRLIGEGLAVREWLLTMSVAVLQTAAWLSIAFLLSAILDQSRTAMGLAIGIGVFQYLFSMITDAVGRESWAVWTVFQHGDPTSILAGEPFPWSDVAYLAVWLVIPAVAGWLIFWRRDIAT